MRRLGAAIDRPIVSALTQNDHDPLAYRRMLELSAEAQDEGSLVIPQVAPRPINLLLGLQTFHPFSYCPSWSEVGLLPIAERVRDGRPGVPGAAPGRGRGDGPGYGPVPRPGSGWSRWGGSRLRAVAGPDDRRAGSARASARGSCTHDDLLGDDDGDALIMRPPLNYSDFNLDAVHEMLASPVTRWGLGDGGAHCGTTGDAPAATFPLTHWPASRRRAVSEQAVRTSRRTQRRSTGWAIAVCSQRAGSGT